MFDRPDREAVVRGLEDVLAMPSAGNGVLYGHYTHRGCDHLPAPANLELDLGRGERSCGRSA